MSKTYRKDGDLIRYADTGSLVYRILEEGKTGYFVTSYILNDPKVLTSSIYFVYKSEVAKS